MKTNLFSSTWKTAGGVAWWPAMSGALCMTAFAIFGFGGGGANQYF